MEDSVIERIEQVLHKNESSESKMVALQLLDALVNTLHEMRNPLYLYGGSRIKRTAIYSRQAEINSLFDIVSQHVITIKELRETLTIKEKECLKLERIIREMREGDT